MKRLDFIKNTILGGLTGLLPIKTFKPAKRDSKQVYLLMKDGSELMFSNAFIVLNFHHASQKWLSEKSLEVCRLELPYRRRHKFHLEEIENYEGRIRQDVDLVEVELMELLEDHYYKMMKNPDQYSKIQVLKQVTKYGDLYDRAMGLNGFYLAQEIEKLASNLLDTKNLLLRL